jgi:hypothetical protein
VSIDFDEKTGARQVTSLRSDSEVGTDWATPDDVLNTVAFLKSQLSLPGLQQQQQQQQQSAFNTNPVADNDARKSPLLENGMFTSRADCQCTSVMVIVMDC